MGERVSLTMAISAAMVVWRNDHASQWNLYDVFVQGGTTSSLLVRIASN